MSEIRIKIVLNKGRHGIPLHRFVKITEEAEKFLAMFNKDLGIQEGEWIAEKFKNGSVAFDSVFYGQVSDIIVAEAQKALDHITDQKTSADTLGFGLRKETFLQYAKIASVLEEDDIINIGLYNGKPRPKKRELSKLRALEIEQQIVTIVKQYGGFQGRISAWFQESHILWVIDLLSDRRISCYYPAEMYKEIWSILRSRDAIVNIEGWLTIKTGTTEPQETKMDVTLIRQAPTYQKGDLEKFFGSDPDFTGHFRTEEYVDFLRDDEKENKGLPN